VGGPSSLGLRFVRYPVSTRCHLSPNPFSGETPVLASPRAASGIFPGQRLARVSGGVTWGQPGRSDQPGFPRVQSINPRLRSDVGCPPSIGGLSGCQCLYHPLSPVSHTDGRGRAPVVNSPNHVILSRLEWRVLVVISLGIGCRSDYAAPVDGIRIDSPGSLTTRGPSLRRSTQLWPLRRPYMLARSPSRRCGRGRRGRHHHQGSLEGSKADFQGPIQLNQGSDAR
jgi:hypothetical protein